jgi:dipeptidyl aminopeptidase/acylaminoacyl peptidase
LLSLLAAVWTIDALLQLAAPSDPQIRPDGSAFAYVYRGSVHVQPLKSGGTAERAGSGSRPRWSPDSKYLAFLDGQIFLSDLSGAQARAVTHAPGRISSFAWAPDSRHIAYLATDASVPEDPIVMGRARSFSRLYVQSVSGEPARLVTTANRHVVSFALSPDYTRAAYAAQPSPENRDSFNVDLYEIDLRTSDERKLVVQPGRDADPYYSPDGRFVAFHSQGGSQNYFEARQIGLISTGGGDIRYITRNHPFDVFRGGTVMRWINTEQIVYTAGRGLTDVLVKHRLQADAAEVLAENISGAASFSANGDTAVYLKTSRERPPEIFVRDAGSERQVTNLQAGIASLPRVRSERVTWKSPDGLQIEGVLWLPIDYQAGKRVPVAVELHGGPTGVALDAFPTPRVYPVQVFLQNGIAVFAPNFRGSSNYGPAFRLKNAQSQGIGDYQDVMSGVDHLIARGIADPDRLGIMGWSYGGYLTAAIIAQTNRFKAASIGAPASDWITYYGQSDGPREVLRSYFGGTPWEVPENYNRHSPRYRLKNIRTPSLLQVGSLDINHNAEIYQALVDHNVPVEYVIYPREGHAITEPQHVRDLMERNLRLLLRRLKPLSREKAKAPSRVQ